MFGPEAKTRLRRATSRSLSRAPSSTCGSRQEGGGPGWLGWGGCSMVNPNVLKSAGIDPDVYQFRLHGVGMERTLLLRSDINDMHDWSRR